MEAPYLIRLWNQFRKSPKIGLVRSNSSWFSAVYMFEKKAVIIAAVINLVFHLGLGIWEVATECDPDQIDKFLGCNDALMDTKSVILVVYSALLMSSVFFGILTGNFYELIASFIATLVLTVDAAIQTSLAIPVRNSLGYSILLLGETIVYQLFVLGCSYSIVKIYTRRMQRRIGADSKTQDQYKMHLLSMSVLKFDITFDIVVIIACTGYGILMHPDKTAYIVVAHIFCILIALTWYGVGYFGMKMENKFLMYLFFLAFILPPAFVITWTSIINWNVKENNAALFLSGNIAVYAVICLCIHLATLILSIMRFRHFGTGLLQTLQRYDAEQYGHGAGDDGFAHLDSDEDFDLNVGFERESVQVSSDISYHRMGDI